MLPFSDRAEAGRFLASELSRVSGATCVVLALPRGGLPAAFEIAAHLGAPLDVLFVKKVGVPWQPELALAAVASGGVRIIDRETVRSLRLPADLVENLIVRKEKELKVGEDVYRAQHPAISLKDRCVILADDGAATGSSMLAALRCARKQGPAEIIVAVPVAAREAAECFRSEADKLVCLASPEPFIAVGRYYRSFAQVSEEEAARLLARCGKTTAKTTVFVSAAGK